MEHKAEHADKDSKTKNADDKNAERIANAMGAYLRLILEVPDAKKAIEHGLHKLDDANEIAASVAEAIKQNRTIKDADLRRINVEVLDYIDQLTTISPMDGRYWEQVKSISSHASEWALIRSRVEVETKYLIALSECEKAGLVKPLSGEEKRGAHKSGAYTVLSGRVARKGD